MGQGGIERRTAAVIRWLERFQNSYRAGALESALMDAECARADLEDLRIDVWERVGRASLPRRLRAGAVCGLLLSTSLIVMATASPIARGEGFIPAAVQAPLPRSPVVAELTPPPALQPEARPSVSPPGQKAVRHEARPQKKERPARKAGVEPVREEVTARHPARVVPDDKLFSLVQTGARALKNEDPVIKIHRRIGKGEDNP
ncbi:MAG: hypothetical protein IJR68_09505 [Fretibacterium sp.]|nr:hypothetical protein [Fretibacterium sp.]